MKAKTIIGQTVAALMFIGGTALAADLHTSKESRGQFTAKVYKFVSEAARGGMHEVRLGELAKQKGVSQAVRDFGQRMVTDHSKAGDELKQIATTKGAVLPTELSHKENSEIEKFEKLSGKDFDKEYAEHMVKDHRADAKEFREAANNATDPELKAFAQKTLNIIEEHLRMAEQMLSTVKSSS